tara:strand:+ start:292 stop:870 length:579 start_codon:yes stop_codon:yes gene_type:complete
MGNRRIGRKRLYGVEKAGQSIDLESGAGMAANIKSASQHRQGQEIITEIAIDLDGLTCGNADKDVIGKTTASYITQLTAAKFGIITEVRVVCVETIANTAADITGHGVDVEAGSGAAGVASGAGGGATGGATRTVMVHSVRVAGSDTSVVQATNALEDLYLYVVNGETATSDEITAGKIIVYIHGFVAPADL